MSKSKQVGTAAETAVKNAFIAAGFGDCRRVVLAGSKDEGDLFVTAPSGTVLCVEVKAGRAAETASTAQVAEWLAETERERMHSGADLGVLVRKRAGYGASRAGQWWCEVEVQPVQVEDAAGISLASRSASSLKFPIRFTLDDLFAMMRGRFM